MELRRGPVSMLGRGPAFLPTVVPASILALQRLSVALSSAQHGVSLKVPIECGVVERKGHPVRNLARIRVQATAARSGMLDMNTFCSMSRSIGFCKIGISLNRGSTLSIS